MNRQEAGRASWERHVAEFGGDVSAYQRYVRSKCSSAACAKNGSKGYHAAIEKHGKRFFRGKWRAWKLEHPSRHEQDVAAMLDEVAPGYKREYEPFPNSDVKPWVVVDFAYPDAKKAVEVNGYWHYAEDHPEQAEHDERKLKRLARQGWQVLVIDHKELQINRTAVSASITAFVAGLTSSEDAPAALAYDDEEVPF